jgi:nucleotide-binding universal stress UspA family protein
MTGIVVGVDGSPNSERALRWAMSEAAKVHAPLTVLAVSEAMKSYWTGNPDPMALESAKLDRTREAAEELTQKVASGLGGAQPTSVNVHVVYGFPAKELVEASHGADLVVVGSRGGGGFSRLLLGSVSSQVVEHAACPVVVIPHEK